MVRRKNVLGKNDINVVNYKEFLDVLINLLNLIQEKRDPYVKNHSQNVSKLSIEIANQLNSKLEKKLDFEFLEYGALLHDFGKIFIPETILNKPTLLNDIEHRTIRLHTTIAYELFNKIAFNKTDNLYGKGKIKIIKDIVLYHHENYDGSGYPKGLKGDKIPIYSRVVRIADVYDALTHDRPYRKALEKEEALEVIINEKEKYDPEILNIFLEVVSQKNFYL